MEMNLDQPGLEVHDEFCFNLALSFWPETLYYKEEYSQFQIHSEEILEDFESLACLYRPKEAVQALVLKE